MQDKARFVPWRYGVMAFSEPSGMERRDQKVFFEFVPLLPG
jgi:hypothetical protein